MYIHPVLAYSGISIPEAPVPGGYAAGDVSGACFNPAVAFGLDFSSRAQLPGLKLQSPERPAHMHTYLCIYICMYNV